MSGSESSTAVTNVATPATASPVRGLHCWQIQPTNGPPTTVVPSVSSV